MKKRGRLLKRSLFFGHCDIYSLPAVIRTMTLELIRLEATVETLQVFTRRKLVERLLPDPGRFHRDASSPTHRAQPQANEENFRIAPRCVDR